MVNQVSKNTVKWGQQQLRFHGGSVKIIFTVIKILVLLKLLKTVKVIGRTKV